MQRRGGAGLCLALLAALLTGCAPTGARREPAPTPSSTESVAQALGREQVPTDTPDRAPAGMLDPRTLRRLAVIAPATWYVGRGRNGTDYCALGVWTNPGGSVSGARCVSETEFTSTGIDTLVGEADRQSRVLIVPDAGAAPRVGWTPVGPSLLVPAAGPLTSPSP